MSRLCCIVCVLVVVLVGCSRKPEPVVVPTPKPAAPPTVREVHGWQTATYEVETAEEAERRWKAAHPGQKSFNEMTPQEKQARLKAMQSNLRPVRPEDEGR